MIPLSWSPDGRAIAGVRIGQNGQLLSGIVVHDLVAQKTRLLPVDFPTPPTSTAFPTLSWLPDSRRGVVRWGERILLADTAAGTITTLLGGLSREGGILRLSADGRWLYKLDTLDEGDLWLASRDASRPAAAADTTR